MKVNFRGIGEREILEIEDARLVYRNFEGRGDRYNRAGERKFSVIIPNDEIKDILVEKGWNVKIKAPSEGYDEPFMHLPVKVKFNGRGPSVYVSSGKNWTKLNEDNVDMLDHIDIASVSMDLRPYDWEVNGQTGRTAYLDAINVIQNVDRFGAMYAARENNSEDMPF